MTGRRIAALLGVPVLLAGAWALGGAVFNHPPVDLGSVVVVGPAAGDQPSTTATGDPSAPGPSPPPSATAAPPVPAPISPAAPEAPTGATRVSGEPAPAAGEDDDDDGIEDGGIDDSITEDDYDEGVVDDDTDS
ncbi:hypothetical protein ABIB35_000857 [Arthrobacter sp. UYP6]